MLQTLLKRRSNGIYYFRWVCTPAIRQLIGKREIVKSLHTTSKIQALARAGTYYMLVDKFKKIERKLKVSEALLRKHGLSLQQVDQGKKSKAEYMDELADSCKFLIPKFSEIFRELGGLYEAPSLKDANKKREEVQNRLKSHYEAATNLQGQYGDGSSIFDDMKKVMDEFIDINFRDILDGISFTTPGSEEEKTYSYTEAYLFHVVSFLGHLISTSGGDFRSYVKDFEKFMIDYLLVIDAKLDPQVRKAQLIDDQKVAIIEKSEFNAAKDKSFNALYREFIDYKTSEGLLEKGRKEYDSYFSAIIYFLGDVPIKVIKKKQIKECLNSYGKLPLRNKKAYKGKAVSELVKMDIPNEDLVANKTVLQVKKLLQGIFRFAVDREYIAHSPVSDLNLKQEKKRPRAAYSKTQVITLLNAAEGFKGKHEWKRWVVRLAAYTGARAGEIVQIRVEDIKTDDDSDIVYLLITPKSGKIKNTNAFRQIPLHSKLIELGFLEFIAGKHARIFPSNASAKAITKWFTTFRGKASIPVENDFGEFYVFHSFRHTVITNLRGAGATDIQVQQIVGHEKTGAGITDNYTHRIPVVDLKPIVELLNYGC